MKEAWSVGLSVLMIKEWLIYLSVSMKEVWSMGLSVLMMEEWPIYLSI